MTSLNTEHTGKIRDDLEGPATQGCKALPMQTALYLKAGWNLYWFWPFCSGMQACNEAPCVVLQHI